MVEDIAVGYKLEAGFASGKKVADLMGQFGSIVTIVWDEAANGPIVET